MYAECQARVSVIETQTRRYGIPEGLATCCDVVVVAAAMDERNEVNLDAASGCSVNATSHACLAATSSR